MGRRREIILGFHTTAMALRVIVLLVSWAPLHLALRSIEDFSAPGKYKGVITAVEDGAGYIETPANGLPEAMRGGSKSQTIRIPFLHNKKQKDIPFERYKAITIRNAMIRSGLDKVKGKKTEKYKVTFDTQLVNKHTHATNIQDAV